MSRSNVTVEDCDCTQKEAQSSKKQDDGWIALSR